MKVLLLCKKFPYPLNDGESIAVNFMAQGLNANGVELTLLAMNTSKHFVEVEKYKEHLGHYHSICTVKVDNRVKALSAFANLFTSQSYHVSRYVTKEFEEQLQGLLIKERFDIIQLETIFLAPYIEAIRSVTRTPILMRAHNIEYEIWERLAQNEGSFLKKKYLSLLANRLKKFEIEQLANYDALLAITQKDLEGYQMLGYQGANMVLPIGLPMDNYRPDWSVFEEKVRFCFIGTMDWQPNIEGVDWFVEEVWSKWEKKENGFYIAGRNTPKERLTIQKNGLHYQGEVEDARAFINAHPVMMVPLLSGSGMRAKILEAMALGRVVITTSVGVEGFAAQHKKHILVADSPAAFLEMMRFCTENREEMKEIGRNAVGFIQEYFGSDALAKKQIAFYNSLL